MKKFSKRSSAAIRQGFTLLELLVAAAVFALMVVLLFAVVSQATRIWQQADNQKNRRQTARVLLEIMVRDLESALFPLDRSNTNSLQFLLNPPDAPSRDSAFWQTAVPGEGARGDMFEVGYFVQWLNGVDGPRSALCRYSVSATNAGVIFDNPAAPWLTAAKLAAFAPGLTDTATYKGVVAENVAGLWITLFDKDGATNGLGPVYDSRTASVRPASAEIGFVLLDPIAARRLASVAYLTNSHPATPEEFMQMLPEPIRSGAQIFRARARFEAAP